MVGLRDQRGDHRGVAACARLKTNVRRLEKPIELLHSSSCLFVEGFAFLAFLRRFLGSPLCSLVLSLSLVVCEEFEYRKEAGAKLASQGLMLWAWRSLCWRLFDERSLG